MRSIVVDHSRRVQSIKRGGGGLLHGDASEAGSPAFDCDCYLDLEKALLEFEVQDPRQAAIFNLIHSGGYTVEQTAEIPDISTATVERDYRIAKDHLLSPA